MANCTINVTTRACPVQIEGTIEGVPYYFRARGNRWSIGIGEDPIMAPIWSYSEEYGQEPFEAGWLPVEEAIGLVHRSLHAYLRDIGYQRAPTYRVRRRRLRPRKYKVRRRPFPAVTGRRAFVGCELNESGPPTVFLFSSRMRVKQWCDFKPGLRYWFMRDLDNYDDIRTRGE